MNIVTEKNGIACTLQVIALLNEEKKLHCQQALKFFRLFNDLVPETDSLMLHTKYSPLQEYLQLQAERHAAAMFSVSVKIEALHVAVNNTKFAAHG